MEYFLIYCDCFIIIFPYITVKNKLPNKLFTLIQSSAEGLCHFMFKESVIFTSYLFYLSYYAFI